jgi:superfamily I DNA/RNA helicase
VDEAQDISAAAFELIRAAVPTGANDLFIVGDAHQRIYRHKVVLSRVGIEVRGRSRSLKVNYRTTDEIRRWACAQLEGCDIDDLDGHADSLRGYQSLTHGDKPDVITSASQSEDLGHIRAILKQLSDDGVEPRQVCIAARTNDDLDGLASELKQAGIAHLRLDRTTTDNASSPAVRLATMHRIKGLEFGVVIIASYRGAETYARAFAREEDAGVTEDTDAVERCLLHVAATRAKRNLFVLKRGSVL